MEVRNFDDEFEEAVAEWRSLWVAESPSLTKSLTLAELPSS